LLQTIFHSMRIESLINRHEGKDLEFKENLDSKNGILATIIAFSNTAGGKLVLGINDKTHAITGISDPHLAEEKLSNIISDSIEPRIAPNIEIIPWRDTHIIIVDVSLGASRPYFLKSKALENSTYIRVGSTNRLADQEFIKVIKRSLVTKTFDEEVMYELNSEEIDFRVASELFAPYRNLGTKEYYSLGICAKEGERIYPTIGGILLFGKDRCKYFPDSWIQMGCFRGVDKSHIIDNQETKDYLPIAVDQAIKFVHKHLFVEIKIEDVTNQESWSIPKVALREAIINAIVHTDYSLSGAPIRISIFDDRIEIENPGLLATGLTIDDIILGISRIRNRVLSRVFHELHLIEKWGSGIQRMILACQEHGLPIPKFEEIGTRFRVTLYRRRIAPVLLDEIDNKIVAALTAHGALSTKDIALKVELSSRTVRIHLIEIIAKGIITEISRGLNDPKKKYNIIKKCN
jgi:ATP-dependent DNA helicase RecG